MNINLPEIIAAPVGSIISSTWNSFIVEFKKTNTDYWVSLKSWQNVSDAGLCYHINDRFGDLSWTLTSPKIETVSVEDLHAAMAEARVSEPNYWSEIDRIYDKICSRLGIEKFAREYKPGDKVWGPSIPTINGTVVKSSVASTRYVYLNDYWTDVDSGATYKALAKFGYYIEYLPKN